MDVMVLQVSLGIHFDVHCQESPYTFEEAGFEACTVEGVTRHGFVEGRVSLPNSVGCQASVATEADWGVPRPQPGVQVACKIQENSG